MFKIRTLAAGVLAGLLLAVFGVTGLAAAAPLTNPTHFDDTYWYWPVNSTGYTQMDTLVTPQADGSPDGYYFSAYYWFARDYPATGGYLGLQTEGARPTGKIAIFSIWGATASSGPGENFSGIEYDPFYTSRIPYSWVVNRPYKLRLALTGSSGASNIWTASVTDTVNGAVSTIGNITVPASRGYLYHISNTFHERYSGDTSSCSSLHTSSVKFTNLLANGSVAPISHLNNQPQNAECASSFATRDITGGIESIIGGQFAVAPTPQPQPITQAPAAPLQPTPRRTTVPTTPTAPATSAAPEVKPSTTSPVPKATLTRQAASIATTANKTPAILYVAAVGVSVAVGLLASWFGVKAFVHILYK